MKLSTRVRVALRSHGLHPRRWLVGAGAYSRYLGYIRPHLLQTTEQEFRVRRQLVAKAWEPRQLAPPVGHRLLAISPHPDDEAIGAGGFLLAHRGRAEIHLLCLCDGSGGRDLDDETQDPGAIVKARSIEFYKTAVALQASSVGFLGFSDGNIPYAPEAIERLRTIVSELKPDVVILPWFLDGQFDHRCANRLYALACGDMEATVFAYEVWSMLEPNALLDITDHLDEKISLIRNYPSQLRLIDYDRYASALASVRAFQGGMIPRRGGAAEAFIALPNREYCELVSQLYGDQPLYSDRTAAAQ